MLGLPCTVNHGNLVRMKSEAAKKNVSVRSCPQPVTVDMDSKVTTASPSFEGLSPH